MTSLTPCQDAARRVSAEARRLDQETAEQPGSKGMAARIRSDVNAIADMIAQLASNLAGVIGFSTGGDPALAAALSNAAKAHLDAEVERCASILANRKASMEARQ